MVDRLGFDLLLGYVYALIKVERHDFGQTSVDLPMAGAIARFFIFDSR